jgi:hypothetical protein
MRTKAQVNASHALMDVSLANRTLAATADLLHSIFKENVSAISAIMYIHL